MGLHAPAPLTHTMDFGLFDLEASPQGGLRNRLGDGENALTAYS
jgi:hypothetical protein